jgi:hypothetical protein
LKRNLNTYTNLNFEAYIVLRSNSGEINEGLRMCSGVGFIRGAEPINLKKRFNVFEAIAL